MACKHKVHKDLRLENIKFAPKLLIIGTFSPEWPETNYATWFYGRTKNNYFWDVLPRMYNEESLRKKDVEAWKKFCTEYGIALTDLLSSINDADPNNPAHIEILSKYQDTDIVQTFEDFELTDIVGILENHPSIEYVFYTRSAGVKLFDQQIKDINTYCEKYDITFKHLFTPSANARFHMKGYIPKNPSLDRNLANFIYERWLQVWPSDNLKT